MMAALSRFFSRLSTNTYLVAICNVCIMALPLSLIATFSDLVVLGANYWRWDSLAIMMGYVGQMASLLFPILLNIYLSTYLSRIWCLPKSAMIASGLTAFFVISQQWHLVADTFPLPNNFAFALLSSYLISQVMVWLKPIAFFRLDKSHNIIDNSFGVLSVSIISVFLLISGGYLTKYIFLLGFQWWEFPDLDLTSFKDGLIYELLRQLSWSLGINGHNVFQVLKSDLYSITIGNLSDAQNFGATIHIISTNFYDFFTGIGGSGNTFALVICLLIFTKDKRQKLLAKAALLLALFNINEPIIYGLPIIFNPIILIPFVFVPLISFVIAYFAFLWEWVPPLTDVQSWLVPPIISGYLATGGSVYGSILQVFLIVISVFCYYPFVCYMDKRTVKFDFLDLFNDRFSGIDEIEVRSKFTSYIPSMHKNFEAQRELEKLQHEGDMILYFQPQVVVENKTVCSLEVLLRYKKHNGEILSPYFISSFKHLNLMPELDLWVLNQALKESKCYLSDYDFSLSVNVSPQTLIYPEFLITVDRLLSRYHFPPERLEFEITEDILCHDIQQTKKMIQSLQLRGIAVALDDFGSGYSSLAYLADLDFNKIKIDRSLVTNLHCEKGQNLFQIAVQLGRITNAIIVVEGVETDIEYQFIEKQKVEVIQGYYFYRPMLLIEALPLLSKKNQPRNTAEKLQLEGQE
jgi:EAL domain-containing protein (putative c-di-GMP-specific phosphodiesterase class I)/cellobiose-specific phosphotransferase system component IIC